MFEPEEGLRELVLSYLKKEEKSISRLYREITDDKIKLHRLVLTGYLKALADVGVLTEKKIPPSKVYSMSGQVQKDIYEQVGDRCRELYEKESDQVDLALYSLQRMFKRPIFLCELKNCGFDVPASGKLANQEDRVNARKLLSKTTIKVPYNDPCYSTKRDMSEGYQDIISKIVVSSLDARKYVAETKQAKLSI